MMHALRAISFCLIQIFFLASTYSQEINSNPQIPEIGKQLPQFVIGPFHYSASGYLDNNLMKGEKYILDFFTAGCSACFESLPEINVLQQRFKDTVHFVMIGFEHRQVRRDYERFREKYRLMMPVIYDSSVFRKFSIDAVPYVIWVNADGSVEAVTTSSELTEKNISLFAAGKQFEFIDRSRPADSVRKNSYSNKKLFLINNNGGNDTNFLFRSVLAKRDNNSVVANMPMTVKGYNDYIQKGRFQCIGVDLSILYRFAYIGQVFWMYGDSLYGNYSFYPVLEMKDSTLFQPNWVNGENVYSYAVAVPTPKADPNYMMKIMQSDLHNYFGFYAKLEDRMMPCWRLLASLHAKNKLRSKRNVQSAERTYSGMKMTDYPVSMLIRIITPILKTKVPIIDETGITENIDITFDADMTDVDDIRKALHEKGLELVPSKKMMKTIVISDR